MDATTLAEEIVTYLSPMLPFLTKAGEKAAEEAGKKVAGIAWEKTKTLWSRLRLQVEKKPLTLAAVNQVMESPKDLRIQETLKRQLENLLADDAFRQPIAELW